jgi:putative endonuclease
MMAMTPEAREELVSGCGRDPGLPTALRGQTNYRFGRRRKVRWNRAYLRTGYRLRNRRWRGGVGEIDLVMENGEGIVFVEVKASRTHERAAASLAGARSTACCKSAEAYIGNCPPDCRHPCVSMWHSSTVAATWM